MLQRQLRPLSPNSIALFYAVFVVMYFQSLAGLNFTADDDYALFRTDPSVWVEQGRWGAYLVERFILPLPAIPYLPLATFGASLCVSFALISTMFGAQRLTWSLLLAFALFIGVPRWIFITEFSANLASTGLGFLCAAGAAYKFDQEVERPQAALWRIARILPAMALLCVAAGLYQSLFVAGLLLSSAVMMWCYASARMNLSQVLAMHAVIAVTGVLAYVLSGLINEAFFTALNLERQTFHADKLLDPLQSLRNFAPGLTAATTAFRTAVWGGDNFYGTSIIAFSVATLAVSAVPIVIASSKSPIRGIMVALWVIGAWVSIVAFQLLAAGNFIPFRVMMHLPALVAALAVIAVSIRWRPAKIGLLILFSVAVFQESVVLNRAAASHFFTATRDAFIAGDLYRRIASVAKPGPGGVFTIHTLGVIPASLVYPMPPSSYVALSWFAHDTQSAGRAARYMRALGYPVQAAQIPGGASAYAEQWASMPTWPAEGSVAAYGEVVLIKLDNAP